MATPFKVGDHVQWNSEAGRISGKITKVHKQDFEFMGRTRRASAEAPQFEVESEKTGRKAAHKGDALTKHSG
ncbi:MAG: DUF2945 domain-containing protein [Burkholderiaceae bacterium]